MFNDHYEEDVSWIFAQDCRDKKRTGNGIHGRAARLRKKESVKMPSEREPDKFRRKVIMKAGPCYVTSLRELNLVDWLTRIENGEWISIQELKDLPFEDGQKIYAQLRRLHTTAEIYKGMNCSAAAVSELSWHFQVARSGNQIIVGEPALEVLRSYADNARNSASIRKQNAEDNESSNGINYAQNGQNGQTQTNNLPATNTRKYTPRGQGRKALEKKAKEEEMQRLIESTYKDNQEQIAPGQITLVEVKKPEIDLLRISVKNIYTAEQVLAFLTRLQLFVEGQNCKFQLSVSLQELENDEDQEL